MRPVVPARHPHRRGSMGLVGWGSGKGDYATEF